MLTFSPRGYTDAYVAKYAPDNSLVWARRMGGDTPESTNGFITDVGRYIALDGTGNVYVAGNFVDSGDFGATTLTSAGDSDVFVTKLDATGTIHWAKRWGTAEKDNAQGVGVDAAGNVYVLGLRTNDNYELPKHDILKFNSSGSTVWTKSIATGGQTVMAGFAVNSSGSVFVAGKFRGSVDFDPSHKRYYVSSGLGSAGFALKLNTDGKFNWVSPFVVNQSGGFSDADSIAVDSSDNVIVGGAYSGSVDFKPGSGTVTLPTSGRGFITKLNSTGGLVWTRALESDSFTNVRGLAVDAAGAVYATGAFQGTVDFNPGVASHTRTTAGSNDIFVVKLTAAGNFSWAETFGASGDDGAFAVSVDTTGAVHVAGWFKGTVDFDPDPLATHLLTGSDTFKNGFLLKLLQS